MSIEAQIDKTVSNLCSKLDYIIEQQSRTVTLDYYRDNMRVITFADGSYPDKIIAYDMNENTAYEFVIYDVVHRVPLGD